MDNLKTFISTGLYMLYIYTQLKHTLGKKKPVLKPALFSLVFTEAKYIVEMFLWLNNPPCRVHCYDQIFKVNHEAAIRLLSSQKSARCLKY